VRKKQARRKKRSKEKQKVREAENQDPDGDGEVEIKLVDLFTPYWLFGLVQIRSFDFGADDKGHKGGTQVLGTLTCSIY